MVEFTVKSGEKTRVLNINLPEMEVKQAEFYIDKGPPTMGSDNNEYGEMGMIQGILISKLSDNTVIPLTGVKVNIILNDKHECISNPVGGSGVWQHPIELIKYNGVGFGVQKIKASVPDFEYEYEGKQYLMKGAEIEFESAYIGIKAREPEIEIVFSNKFGNEVSEINWNDEIDVVVNIDIINPIDGKSLPLYTGKQMLYVLIHIGSQIYKRAVDSEGQAMLGNTKVNESSGFSRSEKFNIKVSFLETKVDKDIPIT